MEAAGLVISVAALTGLFSTCLECFDLIEAGRNISRDLDIAMMKLDGLKVIFLIWGNAIGLHGRENPFNEDILGPNIQRTVYRLLSNLKILFQDAERFRSRYGVKQIHAVEVSESSMNDTSSPADSIVAIRYPQPRLGLFRRQNCWKAKVRWAIHDKKKFSILLEDLKDFIQQLRDITQAAADLASQRRALKAEVLAMSDVESLEILEEATVDDDPELSDVASQRILQLTEGSVTGTDRNRSLFTESIYHTARTHVHTQDFGSELDAVHESMEATTLQESEEPSDSTPDEAGNGEFDEFDLAFSQRNNLKMIQERDRRDFTNSQLDIIESQRILTPHKELMEQKLLQMCSTSSLRTTAHGFMSKWVMKGLRRFYHNPTPLQILGAAIQGPSGSAYEGGVFFISILIPDDCPLKPPKFYFLTPIFHPNIGDDGEILLDCFSTSCFPIWGLENLLQATISILGNPDWTSSCRQDVSFIYSQDPVGFNAMSRVLTQRYARRSEPPEKLFQQHEPEILESFMTQQISPLTSDAAVTWIQLTADDPDIPKVLHPGRSVL